MFPLLSSGLTTYAVIISHNIKDRTFLFAIGLYLHRRIERIKTLLEIKATK